MIAKVQAEVGFALKDELFSQQRVRLLSRQLKEVYPRFKSAQVEKAAQAAFPQLELKQRIYWLVDALEQYLPERFEDVVEILHAALPAPLNPRLSDDDFGLFIWVVPGMYVAKHGCTPDRCERSLDFLREATKRFSSEGAVRPFLRDFPEQTYRFLLECTQDSNYHVRRWASEGSRPYLPWAERVILPLESIVGLLDRLQADSTRFVTRSVANNLNDISKIDASLVVETLKRWKQEGIQEEQELDWMTRHALRTLTKQGDKLALPFLGYTTTPEYRLSMVDVSEKVRVGEALRWRSRIVSKVSQRLNIGLQIHFLKANGTYSPKLFAVKKAQFAAGEKIDIIKQISLKPMTTRVLYPGQHYVEVVVNGVARGKRGFELIDG